MICRPRCSQQRLPEVRCPYSAPIQSKEPKPVYELWYMSSSAGVQSGSEVQQPKKGIVPTCTRQEPSHGLQQNDKHCLKPCLLKALLVNGSLVKIVNTKHAVQLPKSSALLCT